MNGDRGDDFFGNKFPFFDMHREMDEMNRLMEELFKNAGTGFPSFNIEGNSPPVNIPGGFPPIDVSQDSPPSNPRAEMLKDEDDDNKNMDISPKYGSQRRPFSDMMPTDNRLSPFSDGKPVFTRTMRGVHVVKRDDGSVEKTETVDQDGQICKTVTITDPSGKSTSTTTCERSDGPRNLLHPAPFSKFPRSGIDQGSPNVDTPNIVPPSVNSGLNKEDASFFSKLFGGMWSKPKS